MFINRQKSCKDGCVIESHTVVITMVSFHSVDLQTLISELCKWYLETDPLLTEMVEFDGGLVFYRLWLKSEPCDEKQI